MVAMLTDMYILIKWLERRVARHNLTWRSFSYGQRGGYMCGYEVPGKKYYVQRQLFCGDYIESQYYNHLGGKKAGD